jgi:hypothetical protein
MSNHGLAAGNSKFALASPQSMAPDEMRTSILCKVSARRWMDVALSSECTKCEVVHNPMLGYTELSFFFLDRASTKLGGLALSITNKYVLMCGMW